MSTRIQLSVAQDGLSATITVDPGDPVTADDFSRALAEAGVVAGLDEELCAHLVTELQDPAFHCKNLLFAVGRAMEPSRDAWLEPRFNLGIQAGHVREDGSVDYHNRDLLKAVQTGEVLAVVHPPTSGKPGLRVDGSAILPALPNPLNLRFLPGIELESDNQVRARRSGAILYLPNKSIDVVEHLVHDGPVDMRSGNLHMQGSLVVRGDVLHPFNVVTTGDLDITGNVDTATIIAGGSVRIQRGVRGGEGALIHAAGHLVTHHAQSAEIYCGGELALCEAVNSHLVAAVVRVSGRIRGGLVEAETLVVVHEAGAPNGTATELVAAKPLELLVTEAQQFLATDAAATKGHRTSIALAVHNKPTKAPPSARGPESFNSAALAHLAYLERRREELQHTATIEVALAHPGVTLRIGSAHLTIIETVHSMRYHFDSESGTLQATKL